MSKKIISTQGAPSAIGPYSQAVLSNNMLYCSGQIALTKDGEFIDGSVSVQTEQIMSNIDAVLQEAGLTYESIVQTTIYITDINYFAEVNEVYSTYFEGEPPARATVGVASLPKGAKVEIAVIAAL